MPGRQAGRAQAPSGSEIDRIASAKHADRRSRESRRVGAGLRFQTEPLVHTNTVVKLEARAGGDISPVLKKHIPLRRFDSPIANLPLRGSSGDFFAMLSNQAAGIFAAHHPLDVDAVHAAFARALAACQKPEKLPQRTHEITCLATQASQTQEFSCTFPLTRVELIINSKPNSSLRIEEQIVEDIYTVGSAPFASGPADC
jgi:hypothetical protein